MGFSVDAKRISGPSTPQPPLRSGGWRRSTLILLQAVLGASLVIKPLRAQEGAASGSVTDARTREPIANAQVFIPGTEIGTLTDREGQYRLAPLPTGQITFEVRLLGYRPATATATITAGRLSTLDFRLETSPVRLADVTVDVVTGRARRRRQLGSNVAQIDAAGVNKAQIQDFSDFLIGRAEGVILQDISGDIGTSQRIRVRGTASIALENEPLIVVDGILFSNAKLLDAGFTGGQDPSRLNDLSPEDIERIEILKGPAASALYGSGAMGVVLITTKRGAPRGTDWHFYGELAELEDRTDWPLNYAAVQVLGDPDAPVFTENGFNHTDYQACRNHQAAAGECVQDRFLTFNTLRDSRTTPFQKGSRTVYGLGISGGTPAATYFTSAQYKSEDGVVKFDYNDEEKWNLRANLDAALADDVTTSLSLSFVSRDVGFINNDNSLFSVLLSGLAGKAGFVPGAHPDGPEVNDGPNPLNYYFNRNLQDLGEASRSTQETDRFTGSVNTSWRPLDWLSAQGTIGIDLISNYDYVTIQPGLDNLTLDWVEGFRSASRWDRQNWTGYASITADVDIPGIDLASTTTAGAGYQEELWEGVECFGVGLIEGTQSCSSTSQRFVVDEDFLNVVTVGAFLQQELSWADKLFVTGALRMDDDSNFGANAPLQVYPSASISYLVSEEGFFPENDFISELRLRGAWGVAGLRPGFRDAVTLFLPVTATFGGENLPGVTLDETGNELLEAERSTEYELGTDLGLFDDRIGIGFTYFRKTSRDALLERPLPPSLGLTASVWDNAGKMVNQGTEVSLRALMLDDRNVRANLAIQWTTLKNELVDLGYAVEPIVFGPQRHCDRKCRPEFDPRNPDPSLPGYPAGSFWDRPFTYTDADGDGLLSIDEVSVGEAYIWVDEPFPTWTASLQADVDLFRFLRVSALFDARGGYSTYDGMEQFRCGGFRFGEGGGCVATGGEDARLQEQARFIARNHNSARTRIGYLEDATFLKWREISVTLSAPPSLASKHALLERTTLTLSGRNLRTWSGYSGIDPEVNASGGQSGTSNALRQWEFGTQPPVRVLTLRLDVRF